MAAKDSAAGPEANLGDRPLPLGLSLRVGIAFESEMCSRYEISMKSNTARKSSFTLAAAEHAQVLRLRRLLKAPSNTEVIRRSLRLLEESISREELRRQFRVASARVRSSALEEVQELDPLVGDGLEDA
ncbi:hypothetical protein [Candidatus Binatus soli]|uniref:hypothetical protein n=1 Tax=Candidatus Binatus soli TaxID=1953413 RepID=UPI003D0C61E7